MPKGPKYEAVRDCRIEQRLRIGEIRSKPGSQVILSLLKKASCFKDRLLQTEKYIKIVLRK